MNLLSPSCPLHHYHHYHHYYHPRRKLMKSSISSWTAPAKRTTRTKLGTKVEAARAGIWIVGVPGLSLSLCLNLEPGPGPVAAGEGGSTLLGCPGLMLLALVLLTLSSDSRTEMGLTAAQIRVGTCICSGHHHRRRRLRRDLNPWSADENTPPAHDSAQYPNQVRYTLLAVTKSATNP